MEKYFKNLFCAIFGINPDTKTIRVGGQKIKISKKHELDLELIAKSGDWERMFGTPDPAVESWDKLPPEESQKILREVCSVTSPQLKKMFDDFDKEDGIDWSIKKTLA